MSHATPVGYTGEMSLTAPRGWAGLGFLQNGQRPPSGNSGASKGQRFGNRGILSRLPPRVRLPSGPRTTVP